MVIGHLYEDYKALAKEKSPEVALNEVGVHRYCCRRMFISHVDLVGTVTKYLRT